MPAAMRSTHATVPPMISSASSQTRAAAGSSASTMRPEVGVVPARDPEQQARARAREDVPDLGAAVAHVDARRHGADARRGEVGDEIERRGRQEQRDDVAGPHAARPERSAQPIGQGIPVAIAQAFAAVAERVGGGIFPGGMAQQGSDGGGRGHDGRLTASCARTSRSADVASARRGRGRRSSPRSPASAAVMARVSPSASSAPYRARRAWADASRPATGTTISA